MKLLIILISIFLPLSVISQSFTEKITKEYDFEKKGVQNTLMVANINGSIKVTGYEGEKILVEITRTINAKTPERLEKGKQQIKPGVIDRADTIILYTQTLCNQFGRVNKENDNRSDHNRWGYLWNSRENDCQEMVDYIVNYQIKIPVNVNLIVSTVNDGHIEVEHLNGAIVANNMNGGIRLLDISREVNARTINGDVDITYARNPQSASRFYTLNGDINAWFQKGLSANMSFESFNGELFTNVTQLESMPAVVEKKESSKGTRFKVNGNRFKVGNGGVALDFETFNGDVYVKEKI